MKKRYLNRLLSACLAVSLSLSILPFVALAEGEELSYFESFDGESRADVIHGTPAPTTVVIDSEGHGDVLRIDSKAVASSPYFLWVNKDHKWKLTDATVHEDGTVSGVANGITVTRAVVNRDKLDASTLFTLEEVNYYVVTGEYVDAVAGSVNIAVPAKLKMPEFPYAEGTND